MVQAVQSSVQFTPVQVLHAARRAEAEGKMEYALQFYRHLVEQHGSGAEAQEAREGLFRIAEWRWGEARVTRGREATSQQSGNHAYDGASGNGLASNGLASNGLASSGLAGAQQAYFPEQAHHAPAAQDEPALPQIIAREAAQDAQADDLPPFRVRYRAAKTIATGLSILGWVGVLAGFVVATIAAGGLVAEASASGLFGLPLGVVLGVPAVLIGLLLVVAAQLAVAVFESTNATLEMLAIERGRLSF